ncbi:MAG: hypothetical protein B7Z73_19300 [Planctomycetia bacterium 21-64-5]|nr:MAG: hypothetical protein B7Z73_19300 [Planctomycetia bacterium 21-64-5]HQU43028.1 hypothetical protein [Pirellulales bacterium]
METVVRNIRDLDQADRSALERLVGHELRETQQVIVNVVDLNADANAPESSSSFGIADEHAAWLVDSPGWEASQAGTGSTAVYSPDETIELLRARSMKKTSPHSSASTSEPMPGVLLWLKKQ